MNTIHFPKFTIPAFILILFSVSLSIEDSGHLSVKHHDQAALLKEHLANYLLIQASGGWPVISRGDTLKPGVRNPRVALLRKYLSLTGDLVVNVPAVSDSFDTELRTALINFQERHGLTSTGYVDSQTLNAINVPVEKRIQQLQANIARWENFGDLDTQYVFVNVPDYYLDVIENDVSVLEMKTIVGRSYRPSPAFRAHIMYLEFNPAWYVPPGIEARDIIPQVKKDPSYTSRMDMHVYKKTSEGTVTEVDAGTIDWDTTNPKNVFFVQDPGPKNPMGVVKFLFPNRYNVYLHDTPSKELFEKDKRLFSSGCIRISKARELAYYLLSKDDPHWNVHRIDSIIASGRTLQVTLKNPVPVYIEYFTAWVDEAGRLNFREDVYMRDPGLSI